MRKRSIESEIRVWARRQEVVDQLLAGPDRIDLASTHLAEISEKADLVVLAMPTGAMAACIEQVESFRAGALVTDVGSVKAPVVEEIEPLVRERGGFFVGGHPMAGSDRMGMEHADADLYEKAAVILTPSNSAREEDVIRLSRFWESVGAKVSRMGAEEHDRTVAGISHLPHLLAAALVRSVMSKDPRIAEYSGGGFRDTTRVAAGPPEMWSHILADNSAAVSEALDDTVKELESWKAALDALDREALQSFLSEARALRESF